MNELVVRQEWDRNRLIRLIQLLDLKKPWRVSWSLFRERRSLSANALQHVWYREIARELQRRGSAANEKTVKAMMVHSFLGWETMEFTNVETGEKETKERPRSTADLDKGESCFYMQQIEEWAFRMGVPLAAPEDSEYSKWLQEQNR